MLKYKKLYIFFVGLLIVIFISIYTLLNKKTLPIIERTIFLLPVSAENEIIDPNRAFSI